MLRGDHINRVQFDNMQVFEQIDYINNKITEGYELTKIYEVICPTNVNDIFIEEDR